MGEYKSYEPQEFDPAQYQKDYVFLSNHFGQLPELNDQLEHMFASNIQDSVKAQRLAGLKRFLQGLPGEGQLDEYLQKLLRSENRFVYTDVQKALSDFFETGDEKHLEAFKQIQL